MRVSPARRRRIALAALVLLTLVTAGLGTWQWRAARQTVARQSEPAGPAVSASIAPDFTLPDLAGQPVSLSDLRGQVVLLNFWATWCPPCAAEMPDLNALYERYGAEHNFVVVAINKEEEQAVVDAFVADRGLTFPVLLDGDGTVTLNRFVIRSLPMSLIIDREGKVRDAWQGQIARAAMLARLQRVW